ncbi:MAG TPA: type VI secretion system-associated FHA domain protein TagH [Steroidobacteraceae bacterium]|jgi:type VI secretion system FHA domain protein|nr:type VI secretion system-associated FHA domain protein TagH [Steroidobacteraceae bacterium]
MALRLRVISEHRSRLGDKSTFVFGVSGGSIGRSAENDWVLPDDMRYVSGRHARIVFHKGRYLLQDTSSNGTYVNDNEKPLGSQNPHELKSGDILRIGEYHVQVQIDSATDFSLDDSALYKRNSGATSTRRRVPPADLGASLRLENLLEASNDISSDELKPVNAFGQAVSSRTRALMHTQDLPKEPATNPELDVDSEAVARRIARLARAAEKTQREKIAQQPAPAPAPPPPAPVVTPEPPAANNTPGLQAFCRGAGIGAETLPVDAHARMLHLAGQLLRESLLGLKESNRSQQDQRDQLRVTYEKEQHTGMVPSLDRHSVEELIQELLKAHDSRRFDAVQWLRSSFQAGRQHDDALLRAMFAAFIDFIGRLDPRDLATRFERSARRKTMGNWELYGEFYRSLCETPPGTLPHIFVETFAQSYDQLARENDAGSSHSIDAA